MLALLAALHRINVDRHVPTVCDRKLMKDQPSFDFKLIHGRTGCGCDHGGDDPLFFAMFPMPLKDRKIEELQKGKLDFFIVTRQNIP